MKHDAWIEETEIDEQSTMWVMHCKRCGRKTKPLFHKDDARGASEEDSCPGPRSPVKTYHEQDLTSEILQKIYDSEINIVMKWCWDAGITVAVGNAYSYDAGDPESEATLDDINQAVLWLASEVTRIYPKSKFAEWWRSVDREE